MVVKAKPIKLVQINDGSVGNGTQRNFFDEQDRPIYIKVVKLIASPTLERV